MNYSVVIEVSTNATDIHERTAVNWMYLGMPTEKMLLLFNILIYFMERRVWNLYVC